MQITFVYVELIVGMVHINDVKEGDGINFILEYSKADGHLKSLVKILQEREILESKISKSVIKYAKKVDATEMYGTSKKALISFKEETENEGKLRSQFSAAIKELIKAIEVKQKEYKKRLKPLLHEIDKANKKFKSLKQKKTDYDLKYHKSSTECTEINSKIEKESDQHVLTKLKTQLEKAEKTKDSHYDEFQAYEKKVKNLASQFTSKMTDTLNAIQAIVVESQEYWKETLISYNKELCKSGVPSSVTEALEVALSEIDIKKDMNDFIEHNKTGSTRPDGSSPTPTPKE